MSTRKHIHEETFPASPERVFALLHTPSSIRKWWRAACVIVLPSRDGTWAAAWGETEDNPDYITVATIREFQPPHRMVLNTSRYPAKAGPLPFQAEFVMEFLVSPNAEGAKLRVTQEGFPAGSEADEFYAGCKKGWQDTVRRQRIPEAGHAHDPSESPSSDHGSGHAVH